MARKYGIGPRPFSFSPRRLNQLPRQCRSKVGPSSAHKWSKRLNRAPPSAGHPTYHVNVIKLK